jgi:hypothetical protein
MGMGIEYLPHHGRISWEKPMFRQTHYFLGTLLLILVITGQWLASLLPIAWYWQMLAGILATFVLLAACAALVVLLTRNQHDLPAEESSEPPQ